MPALIPKVNALVGSAAAPTAAALTTGELAENKYTGRLYVKTESAAVVDPARVTLSGDVTGSTATATSEAQGGTIVTTLATVPVGKGGTGLTVTPTNGQLLIGNGSGYNLAALSAGANITISNTPGNITITAVGSAGGLGGGIKFFESAGTQTWTVPTGVTSVKVTVIGAGGTNAGNGGASTSSIGGITVTAGGGLAVGTGGSVAAVSSVGLGAGTGGVYAIAESRAATKGTGSNGGYGGGGGGQIGIYYSCNTYYYYVSGGSSIGGGGVEGVMFYGGSPLGSLNLPPSVGYGGSPTSGRFGAGVSGGGGGGYAVYTVGVIPAASYSITVGAGGSGGGGTGLIVVEW
jgi:hypothetical protein